MAEKYGHTVLRLPPYHCELNPIEMIWSLIKGHVARENRTFKVNDVKELQIQGIQNVSAETGKTVSSMELLKKKDVGNRWTYG